MSRTASIAQEYLSEINDLTGDLISNGYVDDQNYMSLQKTGTDTWTLNQAGADMHLALKKRAYEEVYREMLENSAFVLLMLDGAMLQFSYEGDGDQVIRHRVAYMPSPSLESFQNDPELYLHDVRYAEIVGRQVIPVPLRFDLDARPGVATDVLHPVAHLTLGQYQHCRIPVTRSISPAEFTSFVIDNFYSTPDLPRAVLKSHATARNETISTLERALPHIALP